MRPSLFENIYHLLLALSAAAGIWRWRKSDKATRIFTFVLAVTIIAEALALMWIALYRYNLYVYRIFSPLELLGYCVYLNYCIPQLKRRALGWLTGIAGIIIAIAFEYIFPADTLGGHFLLIETVLIVCGCLYACFTMLLRDDEDELPTRYIHFWLVASLLFFWCFSFLSLALYDSHAEDGASFNTMLLEMVNVGNIGMLTGVLYAFIRLPKLLPAS